MKTFDLGNGYITTEVQTRTWETCRV